MSHYLRWIFVGVIGLLLFLQGQTSDAQVESQSLKFKRNVPGDPSGVLPIGTEIHQLADPFFTLVLKEHADTTELSKLLDLIQSDPSKRKLFVVDERIVSHRRPDSRRCVIAFGGGPLKGNVMLSATLTSDELLDQQKFIEVWGWDNNRERYNFYRLDRSSSESKPSWKFSGTSVNADRLTATERRGTCFQCHRNGGPVMKELLPPWNNWHSADSLATYLDGTDAVNRWPIAQSALFKGMLKQAEELEPVIEQAIRRFNTSRINSALKRRDDTRSIEESDGLQMVIEGKRLLRPLFRMTEFNMTSQLDKAAHHPFRAAGNFQSPVRIRNSFFLNANLIAGGGEGLISYRGLEIAEGRSFTEVTKLQRREYEDLVEEFRLSLNGQVPGDADFAWLVPEPSHVDVDLLDQALQRGIITPHFLAAALAVNLEDPLYSSSEREELLTFIPDQFKFEPVAIGSNPNGLPRNQQADKLTRQVAEAIDAAGLPADSLAAKFRERLASQDARELLRRDVQSYLDRIKGKMEGVESRKGEIRRLFQKAIDIRKAVLSDPDLRHLDETGGSLLFPKESN